MKTVEVFVQEYTGGEILVEVSTAHNVVTFQSPLSKACEKISKSAAAAALVAAMAAEIKGPVANTQLVNAEDVLVAIIVTYQIPSPPTKEQN